jgi:multidrug efflux system membrane fusion protein
MSVPANPPSRRRWILLLPIIALFAAGVWFFGFRGGPAKSTDGWRSGPNPAWATSEKGPPLTPVRVVAAKSSPLPVNLKAIGTVTPMQTVTVRSRVDGELMRILVQEGQQVEQGTLLVEIDPTPYRIALAQVEGQQQQNVARLEGARQDLARLETLMEKQLITSQDLDTQRALVRQHEGAVASDKARADDARLQLAYTRIEAPISGRLGLRRVDVGNLVRANDTNGLVVITQTRPVTVIFTVPEIDLQKVLEPLRAGERLAVEAWDRSEQLKLADGMLKTVDNQIDIATGTVRLRAEFPNTDDRLFPNQFVNIRLRVRTVEDALVIPAAAVQFGSRGTYVYVIKPDNRATIHVVVLGPTDGENQAILKGLKAGDQVVLEGIDRLREGRPVYVVTDEPKPAAPAAPKQGKGGGKKG